jgi:hypothetical protein
MLLRSSLAKMQNSSLPNNFLKRSATELPKWLKSGHSVGGCAGFFEEFSGYSPVRAKR